jgi:hypothetical protein
MGLGNPAIVGSAEEVADDLISWVEDNGIDRFNLSRIVTPEELETSSIWWFRSCRSAASASLLPARHPARQAVRWRAAVAVGPSRRDAP